MMKQMALERSMVPVRVVLVLMNTAQRMIMSNSKSMMQIPMIGLQLPFRNVSYLEMNRLLRHTFASYLLKNARVVNADMSEVKDVLLQGGKIADIGTDLTHKTAQVIDCSHKLLIPGGIDTHTHMQLPFMGTYAKDDFDLGSKAAIAGGTTCFIDFAIPNRNQSLDEAYNQWRAWADPKVSCDYALHSAIISDSQNMKEQMKGMVEKGVTSFKFFMAYNNALRLHDEHMFKAFEYARELGAICLVHAQNGDIVEKNQNRLIELGITGPEGHYLSRPPSVEAEAVHRAITLAEHANCPLYIVHLMSVQATQEVQRAKDRGLLVYGETLAAGLGTDGSRLFDLDYDVAARYVMSPSLNPDPRVKTQLMKYLNTGIIDVVGTDNCTFCTEQKRKDKFTQIPNGVNGLEDRLAVVWTKGVEQGLITENQFVFSTSTQAAKIFNLYPRKGVIKVGADADVVVWDPAARKVISSKTHHHNIDFNVFEGMEVKGQAKMTFSNGHLVWNGTNFLNPFKGKYLSRPAFGYVYQRHAAWTSANDPLKLKVNRSKNTTHNTHQTDSDQVTLLHNQITKLKQEKKALEKMLAKSDPKNHFENNQFKDTYNALKQYLPTAVFNNVRQILYGPKAQEVALRVKNVPENIEVKHFKIPCDKEEGRTPRIVKIAAIQNTIVESTSKPISVQKNAIMKKIKGLIEIAAQEGANVIGLQEIWTAPFFMCTREKYPWVQFSEPVDGESTQMLMQLAKKHNIVIVSSILEREKHKDTLHNTAVIIDNHGQILGKQEKGHIPRVGDFNESTYYMEGESGHPVFATEFGNIAVNICYGRHHPLHWMGFGLNGAQVVFNPSATINGLSEPLWGIEARNAAIANGYFAVGINRVGTEVYPHEFTSGDKKEPHKQFGHFYGSSYVAAPDGSRTPSLSRTTDAILVTEVDLNMCRQIKDKWGFTMTGRHKMYAQLLTKYADPSFEPQIIKK